MSVRAWIRAAAVSTAVLALTACSGGASEQEPSSTDPSTPSGTATSATPDPTGTPEQTTENPLEGMTAEQRAGQLVMVGLEADDPAEASLAAVRDDHVGNIFLAGRSTEGVEATADVVDRFTALVDDETTAGVPLLVASDQEGGSVQVLRGDGFSDIPSAVDQATWGTETLVDRATTWGQELAAAGVNFNLAPVVDVVPEATAASNAPIGAFDRQYGATAEDAARGAGAFATGMEAAGVGVSLKHFPGLGLVTQNTDTTAGVTDTETDADSASVAAFRALIEEGPASVMVATAVYERLDPDNPAAFSSAVVTDLLRADLGYDGMVITDDLSAAAQVQSVDPAERAIRAIEAGCDVVLASAVPEDASIMVSAIADRAAEDPDFAERVDESAARVLAAKEQIAATG
ncbi:glycoside hydrolase family 3 N-terminal domain-containing protein [Paraoerskovia marina]|uniref:glycoside hydrolase family 3 N-terminal domain-containing protein n=1 Tax=Paraoerskovia marina TaxID=545619 RepID=UPI0005B7A807|nr:glycoside hydrolase family 3 N-terminal domain-containing protein [Paraoerskovia marina]